MCSSTQRDADDTDDTEGRSFCAVCRVMPFCSARLVYYLWKGVSIVAKNISPADAKREHLLEIRRITLEQNKILQEELNEENLDILDELLAERQQHIDAVDRLGDVATSNKEELLAIFGEIRIRDEQNRRLAQERRDELKGRIEALYKNKKGRQGYRDSGKLSDGAFVDTKR